MLRHISNRWAFCACSGIALAVLGVLSAAAESCPAPNPIHVCTEFYHSDIVLTGKIVSMKQWPQPPDPRNIEGWFYKVEVQDKFRGDLKNVEIYTGNDPTQFPMKVGESYLLFIQKNSEGRWAPYNCGNSAPLAESGDKIKEIQKVLAGQVAGRGGTIAGRVLFGEPGSRTLTSRAPIGVVVTAHSGLGEFKSLSDTAGYFAVPVPVGNYSITAQSLQKALDGDDVSDILPYPLSYQKPDDIEIASGGCSDVQLLAEPR